MIEAGSNSPKVPDDLQEMYAFAIAWRHEFGSERRYGAATVETLIERIAKAEAKLASLEADNTKLREDAEAFRLMRKRGWHNIATSKVLADVRAARSTGKGANGPWKMHGSP
jgi:hypothetical protein